MDIIKQKIVSIIFVIALILAIPSLVLLFLVYAIHFRNSIDEINTILKNYRPTNKAPETVQ